MKNLNIGARLAGAFGVLVVFVVFVGWLGLSRLSLLNEHVREIVEERWAETNLAVTGIALAGEQESHVTRLFLLKDQAEIDRTLSDISETRRKASAVVEKRQSMFVSSEVKELLSKLQEERAAYLAAFDRARGLLAAGQRSSSA